MTALAATDFTVSISQRNVEDRPGQLRRVFADVTFGDGALTYVTGGIPFPAKEKFGFKRAIVFAVVEHPGTNGFFYKFNRADHTLMMYTQGFLTATTGTSTGTAYAIHPFVVPSAGSTTQTKGVFVMGATAATTTYDMGALIQLPATVTPAAMTLRIEMIGE